MLADWRSDMAPLVEPILAAAAEAKTAEKFLAKLAELAADDGAVEALRERLARGAFAARTAARLGLT